MKRKYLALLLALLLLAACLPIGALAAEESLTLQTGWATVTLEPDALRAARTQAGKDELVLSVTELTAKDLPSTAAGLTGATAYDISLNPTKKGAITAFFGGQVTVTIPYRLPEGSDGRDVVVLRLTDDRAPEPIPLAACWGGAVVFRTDRLGAFAITRATRTFRDTGDHWAVDDISFAAAHGLVEGVGDDRFLPNTHVTWAMAVTVLGRMSGVSGATLEAWYTPFMNWAVRTGLIDFGQAPNEPIDRQSMAALLDAYLTLEGQGQSPDAPYALPQYTDREAIGATYRRAVSYLQQTNLMLGRADGSFDPRAGLTRAELTALLRRLTDLRLGKTL